FTSIHPVRLETSTSDRTDGSVGTALKEVKEQLRAIPDNGIGYSILRHLNPHTARRMAALSQPQIAFNYLGAIPAQQDADWAVTTESDAIEGAGDERMPLRRALRFTAVTCDHAAGPQLTITCTWAAELLTEQDIRELGDAWVTALATLAKHAQEPNAGGRTPSDLTLVSLNQSEIDDIAQQLGL
ncbi:condensation domain-containing protein, partial [Streptomyces sp. DSM 41014]